MRTRIYLLTLILMMAALLSVTVMAAPARQGTTSPVLRLHRGQFDARSETIPAPTAALAAPAPGPYAIIQLQGPVLPADREALQKSGLALLEYLPDFAYLVRGTPVQIAAAKTLPQVYALTPFTLADKLSPAMLQASARGDGELGRVRLIGWDHDNGRLAQELQTAGLPATLLATAATLPQLASLSAVRWIEPVGQPRLLNDYSRAIMNVDGVAQNRQFFGAGQILAIADSGLDNGNLGTLSADFTGRVVATHALTTTGHWDDNHGHGTHVAGSAAGAGALSGSNPALHDYASSFAGVAPEANLVIQAFEVDPTGLIIGLDPNHYTLFEQAYNDGARIHSNSWGEETGPISPTTATYGGYPYGAQRTDAFIWDHPDMTILAGAGNSGVDCETFNIFCLGNGIIDPDSLLSPGTAKNVITVGATESNLNFGGLADYPWLAVGIGFWTNPIAGDYLSNNADGMAAFSSRGPADDGRAKPDIVAPGTNIVSSKSNGPGAGVLWMAHETNPDYVYSGGTSMATPLTAGMSVLVREWLNSIGEENPSAALMKAMLLNTTYDIAPGQYGTGNKQEVPNVRPNSIAGWGRADLSFIDAPLPYGLWFDDHGTGMSTGQTISYTDGLGQPLQVLTSTQPLRVMLTWTDPPASLSAGTQLVNDLDLVVTGPGGTYYGNDVSGGDRLNNVEGIVISNPPTGTYQIDIQAFNVPTATQPYALVVAGPLASPVVTPTLAGHSGSGSAADLTWTTDGANCRYDIHQATAPYFTPAGSTKLTPPGPLGAGTAAYSVPSALGDPATNHFYLLRAWNCGADAAVSNEVGEFDFAVVPGS